MALKVTHLNGDSTFLLTFTSPKPPLFSGVPFNPAPFTVLVDPWLTGDSEIYHPKFALARRTQPAAIEHLSQIPPPNVVVISQDRSDHCNEPTLRQLDPQLPNTIILAQGAAAKRIRSWRYFDPSKILAFPTFSSKKASTIVRFHIPASSPGAIAGEATFAFITTKFDMTGVHNAIGITYRPPTSEPPMTPPPMSPTFFNLAGSMSAQHLPLQVPIFHALPLTPPESPKQSVSSSPDLEPQLPSLLDPSPPHSPEHSPMRLQSHEELRGTSKHERNLSASSQNFSRPLSHRRTTSQGLAFPTSPPASSSSTTHTFSSLSAAPTPATSTSFSYAKRPSTAVASPTSPTFSIQTYSSMRPKTLSVLYSPHGVTYGAIRPYATSHLIANSALPLTLLLHSFDRVQNPWYLGGNISAGLPGGMEIAKNLLAKCWVSAHDEDKETSGLSVAKCVTSKWTPEEVMRWLDESEEDGNVLSLAKDKPRRKAKKVGTMVKMLDTGEEMELAA